MNGIQNYVGVNYQPSFQQKRGLRRYGKLAKYVKPETSQKPPRYAKKNWISVPEYTRLMQSFIASDKRKTNRVGHEGMIDAIMQIMNS